MASMLAFPTSFFTVLLGVVVLYWLFVIIGALDVDLFPHAEGVDGALKGAGEAIGAGLKGAGEALDGLKGAGDALVAAKGAGEIAEAHAPTAQEVAGLFGALGFRKVPVTVAASLIIWSAWMFCLLGMTLAAPLLQVAPEWMVGAGVALASSLLSLPVASIFARPIGPLFVVRQADLNTSLIGKMCTLDTGRVDGNFGQALVDDVGAGALIQVRCDRENGLKRGDRALIVDYDKASESFRIEPLDVADAEALGEEQARRPVAAIERQGE